MDKYLVDMWEPDSVMASVLKWAWDLLKTVFKKISDHYVSAIVVAVTGSLLPFVRKHASYLLCYKRKKNEMKMRMEDLERKRQEVESEKAARVQSRFIIPPPVVDWLDGVGRVERDLKTITEVSERWLNRYSLGKKVAECTSEIDDLIKKETEIKWSDEKYPLAKVLSNKASTSTSMSMTSEGVYNEFESRKTIFIKVKEAFQDNSIHRIGLWGLGGVGKTTMMQQLRKSAEGECMFGWIFYASLGQEWKLEDIQQRLVKQLDLKLEKESERTIADQLKSGFHKLASTNSNKTISKKILVMLDDLWNPISLADLGLDFQEDESARFKILIATRYQGVCRGMEVGEDAIFQMKVMEFEEAWTLFQQSTKITNSTYRLLHPSGKEIVKQCAGLPLAIKTIAGSLNKKKKIDAVWRDVLHELKDNRFEALDDVFNVLRFSYNFLDSDDFKEIFLLCCVYPEDCDIPIEDLVRYGTGLRLFRRIDHMDMEDIRNRTWSCVEELKSISFLLDGDKPECVKMHDLVREYGQKHVPVDTKGKPVAMMVNHRGVKEWLEKNTMISLDYSGMHELPDQPMCTELKFLKLINGGYKLDINTGFFHGMEKLEILTLKDMQCSFSPVSLPVFANLRCLSLHYLTLRGDSTFTENLPNLEILSLVGWSNVLPEAIGNFSRLRLLDVTESHDLRVHDSIFPKLQDLEELNFTGREMQLTDANRSDLKVLFSKLTALEFEFASYTVPLEGVNLENLKRFKISVGRKLRRNIDEVEPHDFVQDEHPSKNTLKLVTNKSEILNCKVNSLFASVEILYLVVEDLTSLREVCKVEDFLKLEVLSVERCNRLDYLVYMEGGEANAFGEIRLALSSYIFGSLRKLRLINCDRITRVFFLSIASSLAVLEELEISGCKMLEEVIQLETRKHKTSTRTIKFEFRSLREVSLYNLPKLVGFCKTVDAVEFPLLRSICFSNCNSMKHLFKLSILNLPVQLERLEITSCRKFEAIRSEIVEPNTEEMVIDIEPKPDDRTVTLFPSSLMQRFSHLKELDLFDLHQIQVVFDLEVKAKRGEVSSDNNQAVIQGFEGLETLSLSSLERMSHVWKWRKPERGVGFRFEGFRHLTKIRLSECGSIEYLFTPLIANALVKLQHLTIDNCQKMEEIVSNREEGKELEIYGESMFFPRLDKVKLSSLPILKCIGGTASNGKNDKTNNTIVAATSSLCNSREMDLYECDALLHVIPSCAVLQLQRLEKLSVLSCQKVEDVFESAGISITLDEQNDHIVIESLKKMDLECLPMLKSIWQSRNSLVLHFPNLTSLTIRGCPLLEHLFSYSTFCSLVQLQEFKISRCQNLKVIVEGGNEVEANPNEVEFPHLSTITLEYLSSLEMLFAGKHTIKWPFLHTLEIIKCPNLKTFTSGCLTTPKLEKIKIDYCEHELQDEDLNSKIKSLAKGKGKQGGGEEEEE